MGERAREGSRTLLPCWGRDAPGEERKLGRQWGGSWMREEAWPADGIWRRRGWPPERRRRELFSLSLRSIPCTEKERIEAQVKAAEAAAQFKLDEELRKKREREREAARLALHMMKKTVDIDNSDFLKDLENISKKWELNPPAKLIVDFVDGMELPPGLGSPLERLGLFMKRDVEEEVEDEMEDSISPPSVDVDSTSPPSVDVDSVSPPSVDVGSILPPSVDMDIDGEEGEIGCCG